ncbi:MAG: S8 family serine peptidase [Betaproteobacteria bacterium]|nr:S8 family serine peptidase [Betaproteobacteria bacterium]
MRCFDLQVMPNDDPAAGDTETIGEQDLLIALEGALQQHANEFKVWNLSLGSNEVCSLDDFSEFARELDDLQDKYKVSFVISAGNYVNPPLMSYPREDAHLEIGRITTPADSVLGITVGAISHVDYRDKGPARTSSRPSPVMALDRTMIKPDLVHFGGACSPTRPTRQGFAR